MQRPRISLGLMNFENRLLWSLQPDGMHLLGLAFGVKDRSYAVAASIIGHAIVQEHLARPLSEHYPQFCI
ncbi:MAG: hypothetical protein ACRD7E_20615 [Bryobacteraceae bacterium]